MEKSIPAPGIRMQTDTAPRWRWPILLVTLGSSLGLIAAAGLWWTGATHSDLTRPEVPLLAAASVAAYPRLRRLVGRR